MNLWEGIQSRFLCDLRVEAYDADVDLRGLRATKGDFTDKDLEERIAPMIGPLANGIYEKAERRPTLVFCPQIKSSMAMATALQSLGVNAEWTSGDDPRRDDKVKAYRNGDLQMICAANVFLEGTDLPETAAIGLCRPTKSRPMLSQIVGRGTRLKDGYPDCILIDFNFITQEHDLVKPIELFDAPNLDRGVIDEAQKILDQNPEMSLAVAFEMGEKANAERKLIEIKTEKKKVSWDCMSYRPMQAFETLGVAWRGMRDAQAQPPTQNQVDFLTKLGIEGAEELSKTRASTLLDHITNRMEAMHPDGTKGYASFKMVRMMIRQGVPPAVARNMSKAKSDEWRKKKFEQWGNARRYKRKG
jgi:superfamily II DNA or RNA helicase